MSKFICCCYLQSAKCPQKNRNWQYSIYSRSKGILFFCFNSCHIKHEYSNGLIENSIGICGNPIGSYGGGSSGIEIYVSQ